MASRPRIVIASSHAAESEAFADWLSSEGFDPVKISTSVGAAAEIRSHPCDLLIADFAFAIWDGLHEANRACARSTQAPTVVVGESDSVAQSWAESQRAMYLPRPVGRASLVCAVLMAIMEGRPVRRSPRKTINRFEAFVNTMPACILDVSNEGLRLEISKDHRSSLPPYFSVRVPLVGVTFMAQRIWASTEPGAARTVVLSCGGTLSQNQPRAQQAWRAFVDAVPEIGGSSLSSERVLLAPAIRR